MRGAGAPVAKFAEGSPVNVQPDSLRCAAVVLVNVAVDVPQFVPVP